MWRSLVIGAMLLAVFTAYGQEAKILEIQIADRKVLLPDSTLRVAEGDVVELRWKSDEDVELHLHGYEIAIQVPADGSATMAFDADATGRFPISHHGFGSEMGQAHSHSSILYLEVLPR